MSTGVFEFCLFGMHSPSMREIDLASTAIRSIHVSVRYPSRISYCSYSLTARVSVLVIVAAAFSFMRLLEPLDLRDIAQNLDHFSTWFSQDDH
jgi:hypothetical protein